MADIPRVLSNNVAASQRGGVVTLEPIRFEAEPKEIVRAMRGDVFGEPVTVTFGVKAERTCAPADVPYVSLVRGHLEWGVGGAIFNAVFDIMHGHQITVSCETIAVFASAHDVAPPWVKVNVPGAPVWKVNAALSYGCGGGGAHLTHVAFVNGAGGADDTDRQLIRVPAFAQRVTVQPTDKGRVVVRVFGHGRQLGADFIYEAGGGPDEFGVGQQIPLFGGAEWVEVRNLRAERGTAFVVFGLGL